MIGPHRGRPIPASWPIRDRRLSHGQPIEDPSTPITEESNRGVEQPSRASGRTQQREPGAANGRVERARRSERTSGRAEALVQTAPHYVARVISKQELQPTGCRIQVESPTKKRRDNRSPHRCTARLDPCNPLACLVLTRPPSQIAHAIWRAAVGEPHTDRNGAKRREDRMGFPRGRPAPPISTDAECPAAS